MTGPDTVLILAAHGSSHSRARAALEAFAGLARLEHPGLPVLLALTATPRPGLHPTGSAGKSLAEVLAGLRPPSRGGGPLTLRVQSLHVIAGDEFERMRRELEAFAARTGASLILHGPLLASPEDAPVVALALAESLGRPAPVAGPAGGQAAVLMGHGTTNEAQQLYRALAASLGELAPWARLGVLETADPGDSLSIRAIARNLETAGVRQARLVPFLTVAGRHAHKDLAGDQAGSWKSVLAEHGVLGLPDLAGLVEREAFRSLWLKKRLSTVA